MVCFFCNSLTHVSLHCKIYLNAKSRKKVAVSKGCCETCLIPWKRHNSKCKNNEKCFYCFSLGHYTVYCPERNSIPKFHVPKIDRVLLGRFFKTLNTLEQCSVGFSYPLFSSMLKPLQILNRIIYYEKEINLKTDRIPHDKIIFFGFTSTIQNLFGAKTILCTAKSIVLKDTEISSQNFFQLLSLKTRDITCSGSKIHSKIYFNEILKSAPRISKMKLIQTSNIEITASTQQPLKWKSGTRVWRINNIDFWHDRYENNTGTIDEKIWRKDLCHRV